MHLDKSEWFKHKYVVRKTTYYHIAKRPLTFFKSQFLYMYQLVPCFRLWLTHAVANYINLLLRDNNLHIFMIG